jgi:hypothetical protein
MVRFPVVLARTEGAQFWPLQQGGLQVMDTADLQRLEKAILDRAFRGEM